MEPYKKVLFVSDTDTCMAPMAAAVLKNGPLGGELEVDSRGIVALFPEPMSEKAEAVLISNGIQQTDHKSTPLKEEDFTEDTLVLAITKKQYVDVVDKFGDHDNLYSLSSFLGADQEVPDPYGMSLKDYGACLELITVFIRQLEKQLLEDDHRMQQKILAQEGERELREIRQEMTAGSRPDQEPGAQNAENPDQTEGTEDGR